MSAIAAAVVSLLESDAVPHLADNDFVLFGLAEQFTQDASALDGKWKALQREAHPDKFAAQGANAQRLAMQWSVRINEAYQRLKNPLKRAAYLCELRGAPINAENNTAMPAAFLMQQMAWREQADEAATDAHIEALLAEVSQTKQNLLAQCGRALDEAHAPQAASSMVRSLMFIEKFETELEDKLNVA
ncbi:MAG: Fe-S protein assembly co-chaperone HscB [Cytophagales bacterium]|nr:Fe-S protein assembly co-chaperone HscB [Cytophagales bacterium]